MFSFNESFKKIEDLYNPQAPNQQERTEEYEVEIYIEFVKKLKDLAKEDHRYESLVEITLNKLDSVAKAIFTPTLYPKIEEIE